MIDVKCQVPVKVHFYTHTLYKADARSFIHVRYELAIDVCGSGILDTDIILYIVVVAVLKLMSERNSVRTDDVCTE